jgi:hypothetical protein
MELPLAPSHSACSALFFLLFRITTGTGGSGSDRCGKGAGVGVGVTRLCLSVLASSYRHA